MEGNVWRRQISTHRFPFVSCTRWANYAFRCACNRILVPDCRLHSSSRQKLPDNNKHRDPNTPRRYLRSYSRVRGCCENFANFWETYQLVKGNLQHFLSWPELRSWRSGSLCICHSSRLGLVHRSHLLHLLQWRGSVLYYFNVVWLYLI